MKKAKPKAIRIEKLLNDCRDRLHLRLLNEGVSLSRMVKSADIGRPGLVLAGFSEGFPLGMIQVLGESEILYLRRLGVEEGRGALSRLYSRRVPCIIVTRNMDIPAHLIELSTEKRVPVLATPYSATPIVRYLNAYLSQELAPETTVNGTLVDVYGVGILLTGKSGIGKSECAVDLVERGHRLVADDLVRIVARPPGILIGRSVEPLQNYVEVRGVGLIDIGSIFGVRALRRQKRIELQVSLRSWQEAMEIDRSGLKEEEVEILGISIPSLTVPLVPGKSISVIVEVIALNHLLKMYGYNAALALDERLRARLMKQGKIDFEQKDME